VKQSGTARAFFASSSLMGYSVPVTGEGVFLFSIL